MYFSFRLYKEAIKQSRAVAIVLMVISAIISGLAPVINLIQGKLQEATYVKFLNVNGFVTGLNFISLIVPAILVVRIFDFLFKRSASDFYHALPYTRQCLYLSHFLAAFTWALATLILVVGLPTFFYGINSHVMFKPQFVLYNFIVGLVMMLFVFGAMLIAVSLMGKGLLSLELTAFIIFLPSAIMLLGAATVGHEVKDIININHLPFISLRYNIPAIMILGSMFDYTGYINAFSFLPGILTSLVIAIIYLIIGCVLFCIRRSEFAENAAPNRKLQTVLRIVYSLIFFLAAVTMFIVEPESGAYVALCITGLIVYLLYELITTKKINSVIKSLPGLLIVVVLCVVYVFVMKISESVILDDVPEAGDINSIEMLSEEDNWYWYGEIDYNELLQSEIVVEDKEINSIVAKAYADTTERVKNGEGIDYRNMTMVSLKINENHGSKVRNIFISYEDNTKLHELLLKQPEYYEATYAIPDDAVVTDFVTKEYNENLWKQFIAEYRVLSDEDKLRVLNDGMYGWDYEYSDSAEKAVYFDVSGYYGTKLYSKRYAVIKSLMPKTYDLYYEYEYRENIIKLKNIYDIMQNGASDDGYVNVWFSGLSTKDYYIESFDLYIYYDEKGRFSDAQLSGRWVENTGSKEETFFEGENVATGGDADYDDEYYNVDNWKYITLDEDEANALVDMFIKSFDIDHKADTSKPYLDVSAAYNRYASNRYIYTRVALNINENSFDGLIKYLIDNFD